MRVAASERMKAERRGKETVKNVFCVVMLIGMLTLVVFAFAWQWVWADEVWNDPGREAAEIEVSVWSRILGIEGGE